MNRWLIATLAFLSVILVAPVGAQTPYLDANCGVWQGDTWVPNPTGTCPTDIRHERVAGTITAVKGHLVTVQLTDRSVVIDDSLALNAQTTGRVAVGRQIIAHGYWASGTFYATILTTGTPVTQ